MTAESSIPDVEMLEQTKRAILSQTVQTVKHQGDALQKLMSTTVTSVIQRVSQPHLGRNIDLKG